MKLARENKLEEAAKLQREAQTFARMVLKYGAAPPIKAALRMMGIKAGRCRMPLNTGGTLTPEVKDDIRLELENLGVIEKHSFDPIDKDIEILEVLEKQGITLGHAAGLMTGKASNETVSVGIATILPNLSKSTAF